MELKQHRLGLFSGGTYCGCSDAKYCGCPTCAGNLPEVLISDCENELHVRLALSRDRLRNTHGSFKSKENIHKKERKKERKKMGHTAFSAIKPIKSGKMSQCKFNNAVVSKTDTSQVKKYQNLKKNRK